MGGRVRQRVMARGTCDGTTKTKTISTRDSGQMGGKETLRESVALFVMILNRGRDPSSHGFTLRQEQSLSLLDVFLLCQLILLVLLVVLLFKNNSAVYRKNREYVIHNSS